MADAATWIDWKEREQKMQNDQMIRAMLFDGQAYAVAITARETVERARQIHGLTPVTTAALGRVMMGTLLCSSDIKAQDGDVTATVDGGGPAGKALAVARPNGDVRGYVEHPKADLPPRESDHKLDVCGALGRAGRLTIIKDNGGREPYIGQVQLQTGEVAEDFAYYFALSEQRPCLIFLGVVVDVDGSVKSAGALGVFPLPGCEMYVLDALETRITVASHLSAMLAGGTQLSQCLQVIFDGMNMKLTERTPVRYKCNCSRERMERALISVGKDELLKMRDEDGQAELTCHFCHTTHHFDRDDLQRLIDAATS